MHPRSGASISHDVDQKAILTFTGMFFHVQIIDGEFNAQYHGDGHPLLRRVTGITVDTALPVPVPVPVR